MSEHLPSDPPPSPAAAAPNWRTVIASPLVKVQPSLSLIDHVVPPSAVVMESTSSVVTGMTVPSAKET